MPPACEPETRHPCRSCHQQQRCRPCKRRTKRGPHTAHAILRVLHGLCDLAFRSGDLRPIRHSHHDEDSVAGDCPATCRRVAEKSKSRLIPMHR